MNAEKVSKTVATIEAHFDIRPITPGAQPNYLSCASLLYTFCVEKNIGSVVYYEALFLMGGLVSAASAVPSLAVACLYYASRFDDNEPISIEREIEFAFDETKVRQLRSSIVRNLVGRYRRVTPADYFRSMPNKAACSLADDMLAKVYASNASYYHQSVNVVAPAYYELARQKLLGLPYFQSPAYFDYYTAVDFEEVPPTAIAGLDKDMNFGEAPRRTLHKRGKVEILSVLGEGTYGVVSHARRNGKDVALKAQTEIGSVITELSILSTYMHKNIIRFDGVDANTKTIDIFLELGTSLLNILGEADAEEWYEVQIEGKTSDRQLPLAERRQYQRDCIRGIQFLHEVGVIHRDIKVDNIIVVDGVAKIADFGISTQCVLSASDHGPRSSNVYTVMNRPFELIWFFDKQDYSFPADIWALATILVQIETGCPLVILNSALGLEWDGGDGYELSTASDYIRVLGLPPVALYGRIDFSGPLPKEPLLGVTNGPLRTLFLSMLNYNEHLRPNADEIHAKFISLP